MLDLDYIDWTRNLDLDLGLDLYMIIQDLDLDLDIYVSKSRSRISALKFNTSYQNLGWHRKHKLQK